MPFIYSDLSKGLLCIDGNMIFLPWVCSIVPYDKIYKNKPINDSDSKCVVTFNNKQELVLNVPASTVFKEIEGAI